MQQQKVYTYHYSIGFMGGGILIFAYKPNTQQVFKALQQQLLNNKLFTECKLTISNNDLIMLNNIPIKFIKSNNTLFTLD